MSITIDLWNFSKARNSTKIPSGTPTSLTGVLKSDTSMLRPSIEIQTLQSPQGLNYAYVSTFNRYYFIEDWSYDRGIWTAHLNSDPLASWKTSIGNSAQYVVRAYQNAIEGTPARDDRIVDNAYITKFQNVISQYSQTESPYVANISLGSYIIGIINNDTGSHGAVSYYAMTQSAFGLLRQYLTSETNWDSLDTVFDSVFKYSFDPMRYIISALYVPFSISDLPTDQIPRAILSMGWWNLPVIPNFSYYKINANPIMSKTGTFGIPKHPDAGTIGRYLNNNPYTRYTMIFRPFGEQALDSTYLSDAGGTDPQTLYWTMKVDCITGVGVLEIFNSTEAQNVDSPFQTFRASVGTPVQLAQITQDLIGSAVNVISTVVSAANAVAGAAVAGAATAATGGIAGASAAPLLIGGASQVIQGAYQAYQCALPQLSSQGSNGSYVEYAYIPHLFAQHFKISSPDPIHYGYPLYRSVTISGLTGYIQCNNVKLDIGCTSEESDTIKAYMEAGFYYE